MSQNNPEMDFNITDLPIPQQFAISDEDIQKIAYAVKSKLSEDIVKIINEQTASLITKIDNLEKENSELKNEVDALEQYGRRSLIRISGIPEPTEEGDTTEKVRKIISDINPRYEITNIIRSHRVGKPDEQAAAVVKHRQISVRLLDPGVIFRILKCGKNLKENSEHRHVYINEDPTNAQYDLLPCLAVSQTT
jgi:seryl-tRNA synthetase